MTEINNCENCHHYNSLIHWEEGLFHQCMMGNKLWEKCNDYDAIKGVRKMTEKRLYDVINKAEPRGQSVTYEGIPCTARTCVTRLNRLTEENEQLKIRFNEERLQKEWVCYE